MLNTSSTTPVFTTKEGNLKIDIQYPSEREIYATTKLKITRCTHHCSHDLYISIEEALEMASNIIDICSSLEPDHKTKLQSLEERLNALEEYIKKD